MSFDLSYAKGNVPPEIGTFGDFFGVQTLNLSHNELTGSPSLFPLTCIQYEGIGLRSSVKSYQYDGVT